MATHIATMLTSAEKDALGVALNEATLLDVAIVRESRTARIRFAAFSLDTNRSAGQADVTLVLHPTGRIIASLRQGRWDDPNAAVTPFELEQLGEVVKSFGGLPVYGWEFFGTDDKELALWGSRLSLDWRGVGTGGDVHSFAVFQDGQTRHLDLCFYFDELRIERTPDVRWAWKHSWPVGSAGGKLSGPAIHARKTPGCSRSSERAI